MKRRFFAALMCLCLLLTLLPTTAFAAGTGAIQSGAGGIAKDNKVYFGQKGTTVVPWIALNGSGFLLSEYTIGISKFRQSLTDAGYYNYSTENNMEDSSNLKTVMDGLYNGGGTTLFTDLEQGAVKETTLPGNSMYNDNTPAVGAYLFPLSFSEADSIDWGNTLLQAKSIDAPEGSAGWWWLRSSYNDDRAYYVLEEGRSDIRPIDVSLGVRPAFNLDLNSVLFTSAAVGGKIPAAAGGGAIFEISTTTPDEWKLTLLDDDRSFAAATTAVNGDVLTVAYSGATVGTNEYISAIVKDNSGNITHYGRLKNTTAATDASGTVNVDLSGVTMAATDTLYVFSEQYNGGTSDDTKLTDYASELVEVSQTKNAYAITNTLTNITSDNTSIYRLSSDTTTDYIATLSADTNYTLPASITVNIDGTPLTAGTGYTYDSTSGVLTIYAASIIGDIEITAAGVLPVTTYALTVNLNGGNGGTIGGDYAENDRIPIDAGTKANYSFNGWTSSNGGTFDNASSASTTFTMPGNDTTITANWTYNGGGDTTDYYTLTFNTNSGSAISSITRAEYTTIDLTLSRYIPTREGYEFTGWYSDAGLTNKITSIRLTKNTTIYAGWEDKTNPNTGVDNPFTDVSENDWFFDDVMFVYGNKLMLGTSATTFSPTTTTTRGMIVTILYRLVGEPETTGACPFADVKSGSYYEKAITWAAANGIVGGYGNGKFGPDDSITREQLAAILYRYEQYKGGGFTGNWMFLLDFSDRDKVSDYAYESVCWMTMNGIINGRSNGTFDPQGNATRAEAAAMLHRFCVKIAE